MSLMGFKGKNHPQQVRKRGADDGTDDRGTPLELWRELDAQHHFTLDAAASADNAKCPRYFSRADNALEQCWGGAIVWCNPPYSDLGAWVRKAMAEVLLGSCPKVVMLLPANRCEQAWWQNYIEPFRESSWMRTRFLAGRLRFTWPKDRVVPAKGDRPPFGLVLVTIEKPNRVIRQYRPPA